MFIKTKTSNTIHSMIDIQEISEITDFLNMYKY